MEYLWVMFIVDKITDTGFEKLVLKNTASGTFAEIVPSCGAVLHAFVVVHNNKTINVIDGYNSKEDFKENVTAKGFKSCKLSPFACRVKDATYRFNDNSYTIEKFILNGSALHGLLFDASFSIKDTWANDTGAGVVLQFKYKGTDKGYPFLYDCEVQYELKTDNALTLTTTIINKDKQAIPIQDGWHPYFTFGDSINKLQLFFNSKEIVEFNDALIPTGKLSVYNNFATLQPIGDTTFDNCFTLQANASSPACILKDAAQQIQLEVYPDTSYPYLQLYTPPHRNSIAIENLSAVPDAFNNHTGLTIIAPDGTAHFTTTYKITSLL